MATVAEQLHRAREQQKLTVYQVAEITKIKTEHIRALEAGDFNAFSAPVYIRGFVRTYAKALRLDVTQVAADLEAELGQSEKFSQPPPLTNTPRGPLDFVMLQLARLNRRWLVVTAAALVLLLLGVVEFRSCHAARAADPLKKLGPGLYQSRAPGQSGELVPLPNPNPPARSP